MSVESSRDEYVSCHRATRAAGVSRHEVMRRAMMGLVRVQAEVGRTIRYNLSDLQRIAKDRSEGPA